MPFKWWPEKDATVTAVVALLLALASLLAHVVNAVRGIYHWASERRDERRRRAQVRDARAQLLVILSTMRDRRVTVLEVTEDLALGAELGFDVEILDPHREKAVLYAVLREEWRTW
jgi:heme exporter protein D